VLPSCFIRHSGHTLQTLSEGTQSSLGGTARCRYQSHHDAVTTINPEQQYAVAAPTAHPVLENFRVASFRAALLAGDNPIAAEVLGELMLQSHASYSRCGLGSDGTNRWVALCVDLRPWVALPAQLSAAKYWKGTNR
jgi:hypothetical protein